MLLADAADKLALGELRKYIMQINGRTPDENAKWNVLGREQMREDEQVLLPPAAQGHDGYTVAVTDSDHHRW